MTGKYFHNNAFNVIIASSLMHHHDNIKKVTCSKIHSDDSFYFWTPGSSHPDEKLVTEIMTSLMTNS